MIFAIESNFHLTDKIADFLRNKYCFLIPKRILRYVEASVQYSVRDISISGYIFSCDVIGPDQIKTKQVWPRETGTSYEAIRKFCQAAILKYTKHIQY